MGGIEDMRRTGVTHSLLIEEPEGLFGIGFALDELRRDLADLIQAVEETSNLRKGFVAVR